MSDFARKHRDFRLGIVDLCFLSHDHGVYRRLGVFNPFRIQVDDMFFVANLGRRRRRVIHSLLLVGDFLVHRRDRTIKNFLLLIDPRVLINSHDLVRNIGS